MEKDGELISDRSPRVINDPEEIRSIIMQEHALPYAAEKVFGKERIDLFMGLVHDRRLQELDEILLLEELSEEEMYEFVAHNEDYISLQREFLELAQELVSSLGGKIRYYFNQSIKKDGTLNDNPRLEGILQLVNQISNSQALPVHSFRNRLMGSFEKAFSSYYCFSLYRKANSRIERRGVSSFLRDLQRRCNRDHRDILYGATATSQMIGLVRLVEDYRRPLDHMIQEIGEDMKETNDILFMEIEELAYFRKINLYDRHYNGIPIRLMSFPDHIVTQAVKTHYVCRMKLYFDSSKYSEEEENDIEVHDVMDRKSLRVVIDKKEDEGVLNCSIEKTNGEVCFIASQVPISYVLEDELYQKIRYILLKTVHDYLSSREEDIERLLLTKGDQALIEQVQDEERNEISELQREEIGHLAPDIIEKKAEEDSRLNEEERASIEDAIRKKYRRAWEQCRQKKDDIFRALVRILGNPVRQRGSHCTFKSRDGQGTFALPKGRDIIGGGMLKNCLVRLQISPIELLEYL